MSGCSHRRDRCGLSCTWSSPHTRQTEVQQRSAKVLAALPAAILMCAAFRSAFAVGATERNPSTLVREAGMTSPAIGISSCGVATHAG